jgi:hypothetical protein
MARRTAHHAQPGLLVEPVHLDHDAVGLVRQVVPLLAPRLGERDDAVDVEAGLALRVHREAQRLEPGEGRRLAVDGHGAALGPGPGRLLEHAGLGRWRLLDQLVEPRGELPSGGDLRVLLAQAARAAVAWVRVQRESELLALRVDPGELGLGHEHLAPGLDRGRLREPRRDCLDRAQVGRDVLAGRAVATCGAEREPPLLVAQRDRQAVDLELRDVGQAVGGLGGGCEAQPPPDAGVEGAQLVVAERVREAQHRALVADLREAPPSRRAAHLLGRRVRCDQRRERGLQGHEPAEQLVVLGVRELRRVLLVVQAVRAADLLDQLGMARLGGVRLQGGRFIDEPGVDGQRLRHEGSLRSICVDAGIT